MFNEVTNEPYIDKVEYTVIIFYVSYTGMIIASAKLFNVNLFKLQ
jgi:hypothetical protein